MNLPEKTRLFLPTMVFLWVCSFIPAYGQNWQEFQVLNQGNYLSFQRTILFNENVLQYPDPAIGTLDLQTQGSMLAITFTPNPGAIGVAEFIIEYFPNQFPPSPKIEAFRVFVSTSFVVAGKDFVSVPQNSTSNVLNVLENDVLHGSTSLTIAHIALEKNGNAVVTPDGKLIQFTPDADYVGIAYLTYVVCDNLGQCDKADVNICVVAGGPIQAEDTIYLSTHNKAPVVAILPADGFLLLEDASHGNVSPLSGDTWEYLPDNGFTGVDQFILTKDSYIRYVIVDVYYKDAPNTFVNGDRVFTRIDETVSFDVLANDLKQYPVEGYTDPDIGTLTLDGAGQFTYTPDSAYFGAQSFTYTTCFWNDCETAEVIIYVGDMIPENTETYRLVTPKEVPLVLNYEIPLEGYAFVINAPPASGTLTLHSGTQSVDVLCSTIDGYDLMVYTPPPGFTGSDYFEVLYAIDGGEYHLVKVDIDILDSEPMPCPCVDRCVWPGDADASGRVDVDDLLSLGWQLGNTGPNRSYPDNTMWMGQTGEDWDGNLWGMNSKYADSDGDGVLSSSDIGAISEHYLLAHTLIPEITGLKADYTFDIVPVTTQVDSGDLAVFEIVIGDEINPVLDMHGMSFSLNLPEDLVDSSTVSVDFYDGSWLGHDASTLELQKQPGGGRLDAAFTRTTGKPASGVGKIALLTFIVTDDIEGFKTPDGRVPLRIGINSVSSMASSGTMYDVPGNEAVIYLNPKGADPVSSFEDQVFVFPNPSNGELLNVHANGDRTLMQIEVLNLSGSTVSFQDGITTKQFSPDISGLQNGLYFLRITTTDGVVTRKFEMIGER